VIAGLNDRYSIYIHHWHIAPKAMCFPAGPPFSLMPACSHCVRTTPYRPLGQRPFRKTRVAYWLRQVRILSHNRFTNWRQECFVLSIVPLKNYSAFIVSRERRTWIHISPLSLLLRLLMAWNSLGMTILWFFVPSHNDEQTQNDHPSNVN
jgi:hypothetical protein